MKHLLFVSALVLAFSVATVAQTETTKEPAKKPDATETAKPAAQSTATHAKEATKAKTGTTAKPAASTTPEVSKAKTAEKEAAKKAEHMKKTEPVKKSELPARK